MTVTVLSTPSFGITSTALLARLGSLSSFNSLFRDHWIQFMSSEYGDKSFNSLFRDHWIQFMSSEYGDKSFNSLFRDHDHGSKRLSGPVKELSFNSLFRDHDR